MRLLDEAHYARYDFSTDTKVLEVCQELQQTVRPDLHSGGSDNPVWVAQALTFSHEFVPRA